MNVKNEVPTTKRSFSKDPQFFFQFKQLSEFFFYKFKITGSKLQSQISNVRISFNFTKSSNAQKHFF